MKLYDLELTIFAHVNNIVQEQFPCVASKAGYELKSVIYRKIWFKAFLNNNKKIVQDKMGLHFSLENDSFKHTDISIFSRTRKKLCPVSLGKN
jgi:hypothetical protein